MTGRPTDDTLADARRALAGGQYTLAWDLLRGEESSADSAEGLELRARAAYGHGDFEAAVDAWEHLHALHVDAGDRAEAGRAAAMVAMYLMMDTGLMAPVRGWLRRADQLIVDLPPAPAHAIVAMTRAYERFMCGDMDAARGAAATAIDLGERLDVPPAAVIGRVASARVRIFDGDVAGGVDQLEEVGALLMSGTVDPLTTGMMYCELICAAQGLARFEMASEWTAVMEHWRHGAAFGGINGRCRVHRAEILRMTGPCDEAEAEALGACDELRPWMRREFGWPLVELGTIRLRKGDLDGAEEAFLAALEHAWSPHPGLALLRLERGDVAAASELIASAIAYPFDVPSKERPPFGELRLAPLLEAQSEIALAAGDATTATSAAQALVAIAVTYPGRPLDATARLAAARAALLDGDLERSIDESAAAVAIWADVGAPYETATARLVLADALEAAGHGERARTERCAASAALATFGAARRARAAGALADGAAGIAPPGTTESAAAAVFRRSGGLRSIRFEDRSVQVRDLKGLRYVERLLASPGREFHVLDLVAVERGAMPPAMPPDAAAHQPVGDDGLPVLDEQARESYRRRLAEVDDDIEDARRMSDLGRLELAQRDREYLVAELACAVGLGGRARSTGATAERARTAVTRAIRYALGRLTEHAPAVAAHLEHAVRTGTYCSYEPDPRAPIVWET